MFRISNYCGVDWSIDLFTREGQLIERAMEYMASGQRLMEGKKANDSSEVDRLAYGESLHKMGSEYLANINSRSPEIGGQPLTLVVKLHMDVPFWKNAKFPGCLALSQRAACCHFYPSGYAGLMPDFQSALIDYSLESINPFYAMSDSSTVLDEIPDYVDRMLLSKLPDWVKKVALGLSHKTQETVIIYCFGDGDLEMEFLIYEDLRKPTSYLDSLVKTMNQWASLVTDHE